MPLMKITGPGLVAIACSVALLWACLLGERIVLRQAYSERAAVMRSLAHARGARHARWGGPGAHAVPGPGCLLF
jgi:hypothetical protein